MLLLQKAFSLVTKSFPAVEMFNNCCFSSLDSVRLSCANAFTVLVINAVSFVIKKRFFFFILRVIMLQVKIN